MLGEFERERLEHRRVHLAPRQIFKREAVGRRARPRKRFLGDFFFHRQDPFHGAEFALLIQTLIRLQRNGIRFQEILQKFNLGLIATRHNEKF